ncbi:MAG: PH domain-containing protein [Planctomycetota bacterium]|jgi:membrane protein YdbS with pleckstrin-like domain
MIYERLKDGLLDLLKAPRHPPDPPAGTPESVQIFRAAPNFLKLRLIVWLGGFAVGILGELVFVAVMHGRGEAGGWFELAFGYAALVVTLAASVCKYFLIRIDYDMRYYVVTDRSLRIREGALTIDESTFTYANVQNLRIHQGPVERLLGISNLVVETAGGAGAGGRDKQGESPFGRGHRGVFRGVADARQVRDQMLGLLKRYRDAGLGDPEDRRREALQRRPGGLGPAAVERLREIRQELRLLRDTSGA